VNLIPNGPLKWKENVIEIFDLYTKRTPGSFIEDKGHAITWHYRQSPREFADFLATKLFYELEEHLANSPVQVSRGKKIIEVKSMNANKGYFVQNWLQSSQNKPDIVIAIGDDATDEDMFSVLQERKDIESFCIKVGKEKSLAHFHIDEQKQVNQFLEQVFNAINSK
jgi:trehalose 6-phosphate synthase/phosphatase